MMMFECICYLKSILLMNFPQLLDPDSVRKGPDPLPQVEMFHLPYEFMYQLKQC